MANSNTAQSKQAQAPKRLGKPGPEYRRLDVFVGKWKMEGQQYDGPFGPAAKGSRWQTFWDADATKID
jgi:hypothetical protein